LVRNAKNLYQIKQVPSDTYLRQRLDSIDPEDTRGVFTKIFAFAQRGKVMEQYRYLDGYYVFSSDGTGFYSSNKVQCHSCCIKNRKNGEQEFYHQAFCGVFVHPDIAHVIPVMPEFIYKSDGSTKNDCERNAAKRLFEHLKREHPHLKIMVVEDSLHSNQPHLQHLDSLGMRYIVGVKEGDHAYLFDWIKNADLTVYTIDNNDGMRHAFSFMNNVPLNDAHYDYRVNFLKYTQTDKKGKATRHS
jgi:hypothetical protein